MKHFEMSMFSTREHLYHAKADYMEKLSLRLLHRLKETEEVFEEHDIWYWNGSGDRVDEGL